MKILLCNIAIRKNPDPFPPVACTSLIHALKENGFDAHFYDIDAKRPSSDELFNYFQKEQFDLVGISAVVSTGYLYTKQLSLLIKKTSPLTKVILGGNLAGAYEVILRKTSVDVCVIGEGEKVMANLARLSGKTADPRRFREGLSGIKGIAFLDDNGSCRFTGHEELIPAGKIEEPDYELLEKSSVISQYIQDPLTRIDFSCDPRAHEPERSGKKMATIFTSKGCINSCTFCHRFVKGYRVIPLMKVIDTMKKLIDSYNVGFFCISDECFGEDSVWLEQFIEQVKPFDILFQIGGARVSLVKKNPDIMRRLKSAGLTAVYFGIESGSDKILKLMRKNATKNENLNAIRLCREAGIYTVIQLVIGMPGENDSTIQETITFINAAAEKFAHPQFLAINYLQALPGTACYEFIRSNGWLGSTIDEEEQYLLKVSDVNASEYRQYCNVSEEDRAKVKLWKAKISALTTISWLKAHGWKFPGRRQGRIRELKQLLKNSVLLYRMIDLAGEWFWNGALAVNRISVYGFGKALLIMLGLANGEDRKNYRFHLETLKERINVNLEGVNGSEDNKNRQYAHR
ncbi:MAG: radical SAM protein [Candidatus Omnitrophota bacterium]